MDAPIGVFDSGVGGLTVLRALTARLPEEHTTYPGDTAPAPYGTRVPALRAARRGGVDGRRGTATGGRALPRGPAPRGGRYGPAGLHALSAARERDRQSDGSGAGAGGFRPGDGRGGRAITASARAR